MINLFTKINIEKLLLVCIIGTYFIPNFYATDRIGNQWLYLSIIAFISFIYLIYNKKFNFYYLTKNKGILFYLIFIIWSSITILFAFNKAEAIITFNQYFTIFFCYLLIRTLSESLKNPSKFILNLLVICLLLEIWLSFSPIISDIQNSSLQIRSMAYSGAAANINITAFSIMYKIPLLVYFLTHVNKKWLKYLFAFFFFISIFILTILGTRGALLSLAMFISIYVLYELLSKRNFSQKIRNLLFILTPIICATLININISSADQSNVLNRASTISIETKDGSVNQRLRYYNQAFSHFLKYPLTGSGIGSWKIESIDYDKNNIDGYIIPYHAHNDILQVLAEQGILGVIFYLLFILYSVKNLFKWSLLEHPLNIFLICSLIVYFIDSLLNFPISRPISQLFLIFLLTLISFNEKKPS